MTATAVQPNAFRAVHRYILQLFRTYGPMSDSQLWEAHRIASHDTKLCPPRVTPSGLRSRRCELCPPRGAGLKDSGRRHRTQIGVRPAVIWEIDETVAEPFAGRMG